MTLSLSSSATYALFDRFARIKNAFGHFIIDFDPDLQASSPISSVFRLPSQCDCVSIAHCGLYRRLYWPQSYKTAANIAPDRIARNISIAGTSLCVRTLHARQRFSPFWCRALDDCRRMLLRSTLPIQHVGHSQSSLYIISPLAFARRLSHYRSTNQSKILFHASARLPHFAAATL